MNYLSRVISSSILRGILLIAFVYYHSCDYPKPIPFFLSFALQIKILVSTAVLFPLESPLVL